MPHRFHHSWIQASDFHESMIFHGLSSICKKSDGDQLQLQRENCKKWPVQLFFSSQTVIKSFPVNKITCRPANYNKALYLHAFNTHIYGIVRIMQAILIILTKLTDTKVVINMAHDKFYLDPQINGQVLWQTDHWTTRKIATSKNNEIITNT